MKFFIRCFLLFFGLILASNGLRADDEPPVLTSVAEVRGLSAADAAKSFPVHLRATITFINHGDGWFRVSDGVEGISIGIEAARKRGIWSGGNFTRADNVLGAVIEINGVTGPGSYSPVILPMRIDRVGTGPVPAARRVSMEQLISGSEVSQRVEVEGVVWGARRLSDGKLGLDLMVEGHLCEVEFMLDAGIQSDRLVDARVRVRGFSRPISNFRSEAVKVRLSVPSIDEVEVLRPSTPDPFQSPQVRLNELLSFSRAPDRFNRKVTQGVVNFILPGKFFFLQEGTSGVKVESASTNVEVGDLVEVAGFVDNTHLIAQLTDAVARRVRKATLPAAKHVTVKELLRPKIARLSTPELEKDFAGGLVRLRGLITEVEWRERESLLNIFLISEGHRFRVSLPSLAPPEQMRLVGSEVEVTGVCDLEFKLSGVGVPGTIVDDFSLWLRTPQDVLVLKAAPWWTSARLGLLLAGTCIVLALALAWVGLLRRQVARQMGLIGEKLRGEAVSDERNRLARDLHDTLEQQLAGVALQLDGAEELINQEPVAASQLVALARRMLRHTRLEARRSVWDLRSQVLEIQGLNAALQALAEGVAARNGPEVTVQVSGEIQNLPAGVEFQLLRVAQEALANAIKHAGAKRVVISLEIMPEAIRLRISDDGRGFAPGALTHSESPHFGVLGMQERAAKIGAELSIVGTPSAGCVVTLTLPCGSTPNPQPNYP